jgi:DNA-binding NtrC family response regulator
MGVMDTVRIIPCRSMLRETEILTETVLGRPTVVRSAPPRERKKDILALAGFFISQLRPSLRLTEAAQACLLRHAWPGSAREVKNVLTTALVDSDGDEIDVAHLPGHISGWPEAKPDQPIPSNLAGLERIGIWEAVRKSNGNQNRAASMLGISPRTLYRKLKSYKEEPTDEKLSLVS